jgi:bifunctional non-homologous end joining protein LigD
MRLLRAAQPFDHPEFVYEWKIDGFRSIAFIENGVCRLVSRNGHEFQPWGTLKREVATSIRCKSAVLDGEIACLDGRRPQQLLSTAVSPCGAVLHGVRSRDA